MHLFRLFVLIVVVVLNPYLIAQPFSTVLELPPSSIGDNQTVGSDTQVNVRAGGSIGERFTTGRGNSNVEVNLYGGSIGPVYFAEGDSTLNVFEGQVEVFLQNYGGTVNVYGGEIGPNYQSWADDAVVNVFGGSIDNFFELNRGTANLHGGTFAHPFFSGDSVNLFGSDFRLDGQPITGLTPGESSLITTRGNAILDGVFEDGTPFMFELSGDDDLDLPWTLGDYFADDASLTITLIGGEPIYFDGDFNGDGFVSQADLDLVLLNWGASVLPDTWVAEYQFDGVAVSQNELDAVLVNWGFSTALSGRAVPEPASALAWGLMTLCACRGSRKRGGRLARTRF